MRPRKIPSLDVTPISGIRRLLVAGLLLVASMAVAPASAAGMTCACQKQLVCGADSCDLNEENSCVAADIRLSLSPPAISICTSGACLKGKAAVKTISGNAVLTGSYRLSTAPKQNPTAVIALVNTITGIGLVQTTDEEAVSQYSIICQTAASSGN